MPNAVVEVLRRYSASDEAGLLAAVQAAMVEALKIPEGDRLLRLIAHEPHRFSVPAGKSDPFTLVSLDMMSGRSLDAKRALFVHNLGAFGIPADHIRILLRESEPANWGIRGGLPASEVELGF